MTFDALDAWWWPFLFIAVAGWLATDAWRFLGVYFGGRISEESELLVLVRAIATALVAAVIANLVIFPTGALAATPVWLRIVSVSVGFAAFVTTGNRVIVGILVAQAILAGWFIISG